MIIIILMRMLITITILSVLSDCPEIRLHINNVNLPKLDSCISIPLSNSYKYIYIYNYVYLYMYKYMYLR